MRMKGFRKIRDEKEKACGAVTRPARRKCVAVVAFAPRGYGTMITGVVSAPPMEEVTVTVGGGTVMALPVAGPIVSV